MKKIMIGLMIILGMIFVVSCNPDLNAEREIEGVVVETTEQTINGIEGKLVEWAKALRQKKGASAFEYGNGETSSTWFVYPASAFLAEPGRKVYLRYKLTRADNIPMVYVLKAVDLGLPIKK